MQPEVNFQPLTPTAFLERSGRVFADRTAVIDGELRYSYGELLDRAHRLAGALRDLGVGPGDRVAVLAPNSHVLLECHYGVPMAGAVLVALNMRLTADDFAYIIGHSGARVLIHDHAFAETAAAVAQRVAQPLELVRADGPPESDRYDSLLARAKPHGEPVSDERSMVAIDYTSGTTGRPKGVMYHHRGAYLQALAMAMHTGLDSDSVHLWTLPMFHCNGWCFTWGVTAAGATHLCLRTLEPADIWRHLRHSGVTHFNCAPTVLTMLAWHPDAESGPLPRRVHNAIGGAPPTPALLQRLDALGIEVTHLYGLTETYGPAMLCQWRSEWNSLPAGEQVRIKARQGVNNVIGEPVRVVDGEGADVPADGATLGEIALRGNNIMLGYYRDPEATRRAVPDGWYRTGDLGVMHPDGYVELKDRSKDIIISGGENIASVEVENVLASHPAIMEVAVVAAPDPKWGEIPVAFVTLKPDAPDTTGEELIAWVRERLAHFKAPRRVVFGELPRNATGKIQKFVLRGRLREGR
ncbi:MAG TPA: acyl--CoA ligase family protein [Gammaproteobacteria bacterium]|nr:acyl--CoA ligase family protein [Gammaproteobacteria bacterium]